MEIDVKVGDVDLTTELYPETEYRHPETIGDVVARELANRFVNNRDLWPPLMQRVTELRDEEIRAQIAPLIAEAIGGGITQTNAFGETTGKPTTLREVIVAEVKRTVTKPVSSGYSETLLQKIVREEVAKTFTTVVREEVAKARDLVADKIGEEIASSVKAGLRAR
jgi:hypothetical protein